MQFNSYIFIFLFLPVSIAGYYLLNRWNSAAGKIELIAASAVFYLYAGVQPAVILLLSIILNYGISILISKNTGYKKILLITAIFINIGSLVYYKYHDFYIEKIGWFMDSQELTAKLILPLGISFFSFQQIAFVVYIYRNPNRMAGLADYLLYILYFPKLIMGPIAEPEDLITQFNDSNRKKLDLNNVAAGARIFSYGLLKKTLLADTFTAAASWGFSHVETATSMDLFIVMLSYTFEMYFDFSGYCDMATGISQMLNIDLPINFNSPYKAISIRDHWKRWHISLTKFLTKYVYFPLGGSRKGAIRTCLNIMIVFFVSGIWHGANWTFWLWGALHGALNVLERIFDKTLEKIYVLVRWIFTFLETCVLMLLIGCESVKQWGEILKQIFCFQNTLVSEELIKIFTVPETQFIVDKLHLSPICDSVRGFWLLIFVIAAFGICLIPQNNYNTRKSVSLIGAITSAVAFVWGLICIGGESVFVYFGF